VHTADRVGGAATRRQTEKRCEDEGAEKVEDESVVGLEGAEDFVV
jgi:hypothetical protein